MTETMRGVVAPPTFQPRMPRRASLGPRLLKPGLALAAIAGLGLTFLRPAPAVAGGWSAAQDATRGAAFRHDRTYLDGVLDTETWRGPTGVASVKLSRGKVTFETRINRKREYRFWDWIDARGSLNTGVNARASGRVRDYVRRPNDEGYKSPEEKMSEILANGQAKRAANPPDEKGTWYDVVVRYPELEKYRKKEWPAFTMSYLVRVGEDNRIAESRHVWRSSPGQMRTLYDYPDTIPSRAFEPRPQARIVPTIDIDANRREMERRMRSGSGERLGVNLRLALLDKEGKLFVFWTGPAVGEGTRGDVRLPGVRSHRATGLWAEFAQFNSPAKREIAPAIGRTMPGRGIVPLVKIGPKVTIAIPGRGGEAVFRNVPVLRVDEIRYDRHLLGYGAPPGPPKR